MRNNKTLVALIGLVITAIIVVVAVLILIIALKENGTSVDDIKGKIILNPTAIVDSILPGEAKAVEIKADLTGITVKEGEQPRTLVWTIDNDKVATIQGNGNTAILTLKAAGNAVVTVTYGDVSATCTVIVNSLVPKITLSETSISETYIAGKTATVTITATPENIPELDKAAGEDKASLKWESDNEEVATVEANGNTANITLKSAGKAVITVSYGDITAKCEVTAIEVTQKITLDKTSVSKTIISGKTQTVELSAVAENITGKMTWTSSNTNVATVKANNDKATVTLKAGGTATITVTAGNVSATCQITVIEEKQKITLDKTSVSKTIISGNTQIVELSAVAENITGKMTWTSSNTKVATVKANNDKATVTLKAGGTATITVTAGNVSATCKIEVTEKKQEITENKTPVIILDTNSIVKSIVKGTTQKETIIATTQNVSGNLTWTSSNTSVATVSGSGNAATVTLVGAGTTTITAKYGSATATCKVTVTELMPTITLDTNSIVKGIVKGTTQKETIVATIKNITGNLTWTSSNTKVATVSSSGNTATVTLVGGGTATITAKYGTTTATCKVTVTELMPKITLDKTSITGIESANCTTQTITAITENIPGNITWTSSNTSVAKVSGNGKTATISICSGGTAIITAKYGTTTATCKVTVLVPKITLNKTNIKVTDYPDTQDIILTATTENITGNITWTSGNTNVAKVSGSGKTVVVDVCGRGTATITAISPVGDNVRATCVITVTPKITMNKTTLSATIEQGTTKRADLTLTTENLNSTQISAIQWTSSDTSVATVSGSGKTATVTFVGAGTATITAQHSLTNKVTCKVTVTEVVPKITLNKTSATVSTAFIGTTAITSTLTATTENVTGNITWTSSNTSVATVTGNGKTATVTFLKAGTVTITAKYGTAMATCNFTVIEKKLKLNKTSITLTESISPSQTLTATTENITGDLTWTSSDTSVATVTGNGNTATVKFVKAGTATITVRSGSVTATCTVTCVVPKITLDKTSVKVTDYPNASAITLTATTENITGNLTWTTSNTGVARVVGSGKTATVTVVGTGTATITAKYGSKSDTCTITVTPKIILNKTAITETIIQGQSNQTTLLLTTENIDSSYFPSITWESSNTNVATVSGSEKTAIVTFVGAGTATITAKLGTRTATCTVKVSELVPKITLDKTSISLVEGRNMPSSTITAATENITGDLTWTSSNTKVAKVVGSGKTATVTMVGVGTAIITAKHGTTTATCTVNGLAQKITLDKTNINVTGYNGPGSVTYTLTATTQNINGGLTWTSTNPSVATVTSNGKTATVTIQRRGTTTINVSNGYKIASCTISIEASLIFYGEDRITLSRGSSHNIMVTPKNLTDSEIEGLTWECVGYTLATAGVKPYTADASKIAYGKKARIYVASYAAVGKTYTIRVSGAGVYAVYYVTAKE